jgi:molecular chaperone IbpA
MSWNKFDPTPLWRSTVGFDRLFHLIDETARWSSEDNYPPYNIERTGEDQYQISLALAGFAPEDVTITAEQNVLTVEGRKSERRSSTSTFIRASRRDLSSARTTSPITSR